MFSLDAASGARCNSPAPSVRGFLRLTIALLLIGGMSVLAAQGMRDFHNRSEGTTARPNALEDFAIIGVHRSFRPFPRNANINVGFFLPTAPNNPPKTVFVEAAELQNSFHYLMRSKSSIAWKDGAWNVFAGWPTADVIDPLGVQSSNLGILAGYRIDNRPTVYLPVDVYHDDPKPVKLTYTFHFVTGQDLQTLDISVTNSNNPDVNLKKQLKCNTTFNRNCRLYAAGSTQAFDLDDMSSKPAGEYTLKLLGRAPGVTMPTSLSIVFYHRP